MATKKPKFFDFKSPADCEKLVGHVDTIASFMAAWDNRDNHPIHPVWILAGTNGIGKATLAHHLAKQIYGNIGDFFVIDRERNIDKDGKPKPDTKTISVYTVRDVIKKLQSSSMSGGWRVVLVDSVDELRMPNASNAMLKILEEPPQKTIFFLIVNQLANTLPTIRSRARVEKMRPLTRTNLEELCLTLMPDEKISPEIFNLANGSFGKIANLKATGGDKIYLQMLDLLKNPNTPSTALMELAADIASYPELHPLVLDVIAHFGLADMYPTATGILNDIKSLNIDAKTSIFKILTEIKKCL